MKKLFIIDMDNTILDTVGLKEAIGVELGGNPKMSAVEIVDYFKRGDRRVEKFIEKNIDKFIFKGVQEKLKKMKKNNKLILLTHGLVSFQAVKTKHLSIKCFDEIILTENDSLKIDNTRKILERYPDYKIYFINDNLRQNDAIRNEFGDRLVVSDIDNYAEKADSHINSVLGEILQQIISDIDKLKN